MKKAVVLLFILSLSLNVNAQKQETSQDSIKVFYDVLFSNLQKQYLFKKNVDWRTVKSETKQNLTKFTDFKSSLNELENLFAKIGATHCIVRYKENQYAIPFQIAPNLLSENLKEKLATKPDFEAKIIDGKYGYILMPKISPSDFSPEYTHKIAQPLYDQIIDLKSNNKLKGWIIDLRLNTGGNAEPMLLALYDFLGDNIVWGSLDVKKNQLFSYSLDKGNYIFNIGKKPFKQSYINPKGDLLVTTKVAIITGAITASSGEVTALAFKGRSNTIFIGGTTSGYTTGNINVDLPFESLLLLTTSYDSDRNGTYYERILPDIPVSKQDNFDDLLLDGNIQEAIKFISKKD